MHNQPRFYPQRGTTFYPDGRSVRPQVPDTVARSQQITGTYFTTGMQGGSEGDGLPMTLTPDLMLRGQERYNIYCTPCHSRTGYGQGMIVQRGYQPAASFHTERLRQAPLGHFFFVITNGYGAMPDYAAQLTPEDRWAVAAYVRALQLSQNAKEPDAAGQHIAPLNEIAAQQGMAPSFADMDFWLHRAPARPVAAALPAPVSAGTTEAAPSAPALPAQSGSAAAGGQADVKPVPSTTAKPGEEAKDAVPAPKPKQAAGNITAGKAVYEANCSLCHQSDLTGLPPKIPAIAGVVARTGEAHVRDMINNGAPDARPMMPAFGEKLSATEITDLIAFLKSYKAAE